jgi:hypothetical protein
MRENEIEIERVKAGETDIEEGGECVFETEGEGDRECV